MRKEESTANPLKQEGHDDANANPGSGASGPGEPGYDGNSTINVQGGEGEIDMESKAARMEAGDESADPAAPYLDEGTPGVDPTEQAAG